MRPFILRVFGFGALLTVLLVGAQLFYTTIVRAGVHRTDREFWEASDDVSILVIGDSHARNGFDTREIGGSYNLTTSGENFVQTYFKLKAVLADSARGRSIHTVVVPFDLHSFSSYKSHRFPEMYFWDRYVDWGEVGRALGDPWGFRIRSLVERAFPYAGNWRILRSWALGSGIPEQEFEAGFLVERESLTRLTPSERAHGPFERAGHHFAGQRHPDPMMLEYFRKILELCEVTGKEVLLVRYPVTDECLAAAVDSFGVDPALPGPEALAARYGHFPLQEYWRAFGDRPELFFDPDHLNQAGAREFTRML
ncbi:MAG: hypothetical protein KJN92_12705, partial [Gemmatimonadetes bacterium]|nr:hypothetical protein [Gemmatimonadota bacterium]